MASALYVHDGNDAPPPSHAATQETILSREAIKPPIEPPPRKSSTRQPPRSTMSDTSIRLTYKKAEYLRSVDERAWRSEYLCEVTGTSGSVFNNVVSVCLSDAACRGFSRTRCGVDWGWFPDPWRFVRCGWEPGERRLFLFQELSANRKTPAETGAMAAEALTYADEPGGDPYQHDELIWADDTPDGKQSMALWRRELGLRVRPT